MEDAKKYVHDLVISRLLEGVPEAKHAEITNSLTIQFARVAPPPPPLAMAAHYFQRLVSSSSSASQQSDWLYHRNNMPSFKAPLRMMAPAVDGWMGGSEEGRGRSIRQALSEIVQSGWLGEGEE